MLSDDFFGGIAFDALRALIPTHDVPGGIQHDNRVVLHILHQQMKAFIALIQLVRAVFDLLARPVQRLIQDANQPTDQDKDAQRNRRRWIGEAV